HLSKSLPGPTLPLLGSRDIQNGELVSIFGYGLDENQKIDVLKSGEMKVSGVTDNHIFAKFDGAGSNTCNGDSGGPAIYTFTKDGREIDAVVGVVSTGEIVDCSAGDTTLFANAHSSSNLSFITQSVPSTRVE
ncbi:MAG: trypsin-like serine protease, partial [Bdellovibrionales bacterium]|nr:trypsin-like serine protease [Bdellovibrionales bacterium]